jgi:hypothetical protein
MFTKTSDMRNSMDNKKDKQYFYDVHMHAFNLSHAGLIAYINRSLTDHGVSLNDLFKKSFFTNLSRVWSYNTKKNLSFNQKIKKLFIRYIYIISYILATCMFLYVWVYSTNIDSLISENITKSVFVAKALLVLWIIIGLSIFLALSVFTVLFVLIKLINKKANSFIKDSLSKALNLFSFMENDIGSQFKLLDDELKYYNTEKTNNLSHKDIVRFKKNNFKKDFEISGYKFNKVVLTPLVMDFGYKGKDDFSEIFYNTTPVKPVLSQLHDLFQGIKSYRNYSNLFEIYPFLGINPVNYSLDKEEQEETGKVMVSRLMDKYFKSDFKETGRHTRFLESYKKIEIDRLLSPEQKVPSEQRSEEEKEIYRYLFSGIKLYPPLGFNPWPEDNEREKEKNRGLFKFCRDNKIPVTTHCNNGGWTVTESKNVKAYTDPECWRKVLEQFPGLYLNFAHFGGTVKGENRLNQKRQESIINLIKEFENVYTDISCIFDSKQRYDCLNKLLDNEEKLRNKILFGSDFPMILAAQTKNYIDYLKLFFDNLKPEYITMLSVENPKRFLWGE